MGRLTTTFTRGDGKRGDAQASVLALILDSTQVPPRRLRAGSAGKKSFPHSRTFWA